MTTEQEIRKIIENYIAEDDDAPPIILKDLEKEQRAIYHNITDEYIQLTHKSSGGRKNRLLKISKSEQILLPCKYTTQTKSWTKTEERSIDVENIKQLTFLNFNVLFELFACPNMNEIANTCKRRIKLFELLDSFNSDFITLQEVTPDLLEDLKEQECEMLESVTPSGNLILSKFMFDSVKLVQHQKQKNFLQANFNINNESFQIYVVHFSATIERAHIRKTQITDVVNRDKKFGKPNTLIVGDVNLRHETDELLEDNYVDIWPCLHKDDPGYTFDHEKNSMLEAIATDNGNVSENARFDRFLLNKDCQWLPKEIQIVGNKAIDDTVTPFGNQIFISDHFGLFVTIQL